MPDNYIPANPLSTPAHIVPEWYFWPFYAILRAFTSDFILPAKLWGVLAMFGVDPPALLPALARPVAGPLGQLPADVPDRSSGSWLVDVLVLGYCGGSPAEEPFVMISQVATDVLFRPLPDHPADPLLDRADEAAAQFDLGIGAARRGSGGGARTRSAGSAPRPRNKGKTQRWSVSSDSSPASAHGRSSSLWSFGRGVYAYITDPPEQTVEKRFHVEPRHLALASDGPFGKFDRAAAPARLPGLQGGLLGLPLAEAGRVPRPRATSAIARPR